MGSIIDKVRVGLAAALAVFGVWGCSDDGGEGAPAPPAETVESRPGIVQGGDDDGPVLGEAETCAEFRGSISSNRERLACDSAPLLQCPELIRPLASLTCVTFSESSLAQCVEAFEAADECSDLVPGACVLTAVLHVRDPACNVNDAAADGGMEVTTDAGGLTSDASSEPSGDASPADASSADSGVTTLQPDSDIVTSGDGTGGETTGAETSEAATSSDGVSSASPADTSMGSSATPDQTQATSQPDAG